MRCGELVCVGLVCGAAAAQVQRRPPVQTPVRQVSAGISASAAAELISLGGRAGVIFVGRVLEVARNEDAGYVDVVFGIETAVRGCERTTRYVLREWAGLWIGQPPRYEMKQKLLMLLSGRGPSGMSAPVGGMAGAIPLVSVRQPPLVRGTEAAPADTAFEDSMEEAVDVRWLEAFALRKAAAESKASLWAEAIRVGGWGGPIGPLPPHKLEATAGPSLSAVLTLLGFHETR